MTTLIIKLMKDELYFLEFIKPIVEIIKNLKTKKTKCIYFKNLKQKDFDESSRIIIPGTYLKDFEYINNIDEFKWIKNYNKQILGICSGMQIISKIYGSELIDDKEIGVVELSYKKNLLKDIKNVYALHNLGIKNVDNFQIIAKSKQSILGIKHNKKPIYGMMFHPEVLNKKIIEKFIKI